VNERGEIFVFLEKLRMKMRLQYTQKTKHENLRGKANEVGEHGVNEGQENFF
jgi:hypothetical protein